MPTEILTPAVSFKMTADGNIEIVNMFPKTTTISAEHIIDLDLLHEENPAVVEHYIRAELARKIAEKLIEEDLMIIQTSDNPSTMERTVRATVKFIQE